MKRIDSRLPSEIRSLACSTGELFQASGSARWSQGFSSVLVAVYGPSLTPNPEANEAGILDIAFHATRIDIGAKEAEIKTKLQSVLQTMVILKSFPRTFLKLSIQVLFDDGCILSCAFNAACVALMDAGIPLKSQWVSTTIGVTHEDISLLDPDKEEEKICKARVCAVFTSCRSSDTGSGRQLEVSKDPISCEMSGSLSSELLFRVLEVCNKASEKVALFNIQSAEKRFQHLLNQS